MKAQDLKNSVLQLAIQGKLVEQNPNDEPASVLLEKIKAEKEKLIKEKKIKREKPLPEIMEEEKPFEIPESWEWLRLSEIAWLSDGKKIENAKFPYLEVKYLRGSKEAEIKNKGKFIEKNNLVILVDGENSGEVFVVGENGYLGSTFKVLSYSKEIYWEYLMWLLRCYQEKFKNNKTGSAIPHLNKMLFKNLPIGLPPLEEQKRIVVKIEEVLEKIEEYDKAEKELSELEETFPQDMKKSILQYAIQGKLVEQNPNDESASVLLEKIKAEKEKLIKEKKIKKEKPLPEISEEEKPFEIPESWEWVRIGELSKLVTKGTTPRGGNVAYIDKGIGFLRAENVIGIDKLELSNLKYINEETHQGYLKRSILEENDFLITIAGTLGRTGIVRQCDLPLNANQAVAIVRLVNPEMINLVYLSIIVNSPCVQKMLISQKKITAIPNLTLEIISNCIIPIPPLEEQKRIVAKIEKLLNYVDKLKKRIDNQNLINKIVKAKSIELSESKELINN